MRTPRTPDSNPGNRFSDNGEPLSSKQPSIVDLISIDELQEMQDSFSEVAKVSVRTIDTCGNLITDVSRLPSLCSKIFQSTSLIEKYCTSNRPMFLGGSSIVDDELSYECFPGLKNYIVPLKVSVSETDSLILGYMIIGPVFFMKREDKESYRKVSDELGVSLEEIWSNVLEFRVFSHKGIHSLLEMIENLTNRLLTLAYRRFLSDADRSERKESEYKTADKDRSKEFLETFLDLVVETTDGDIASVMLLDQRKKVLAIRACRGLSEEIVNKTSVKLGDGLCGLAAAGKRAFLINEDAPDTELSSRLKRSEIFSSMIVPIKYRQKVLGVINVSSDRKSLIKFDKTNLSLLTKIANLAGITLEAMC